MPSEMKRLKQLEEENGKLKRIVADLALDRRCCRTSSSESYEACAAARSG
jgi:DNA-directed RNA polymerase subunit N (RpoN/RPB10)